MGRLLDRIASLLHQRDRETGPGEPAPAGPRHAGPAAVVTTSDPAETATAVADLRAAVDFLDGCTPAEQAAVEAANAPLSVDEVHEILRDAGLRGYEDALSRHEALPEHERASTPPPAPDPDLVQAARDVLALRA